MKILDRIFNPREIRRGLGLNQEQFWTPIGVTQSGGSRYESGREMPRPVKELLRLVHVEQIDLAQVKHVDFEIISYLKESLPDLYRSLRRAVKERQKSAGGAPAAGPDGAIWDDLDDAEMAVTSGGIDLPRTDAGILRDAKTRASDREPARRAARKLARNCTLRASGEPLHAVAWRVYLAAAGGGARSLARMTVSLRQPKR